MRKVRAKLLRKQALEIASTSQLTAIGRAKAIFGGKVRKSNQAKWQGFKRVYRDLKKAWNSRGEKSNDIYKAGRRTRKSSARKLT